MGGALTVLYGMSIRDICIPRIVAEDGMSARGFM